MGKLSDGSITFDTKIDEEDFEKGIKGIKNRLKGFNNAVDGMSKEAQKAFRGISSSQISLVNQIDQTKYKIEELKKQISEMEGKQIEKEQFAEIEHAIARASAKYAILNKEKKKRDSSSKTDKESAGYRRLTQDIKDTEQALGALQKKRDSMLSSGVAFQSAGLTSESQSLRINLEQEESKLTQLGRKLEETEQKGKKTGSSITNSFKKFGSFLGNLGKKIAGVFTKGKKSGSDFAKSFLRIGNMLKGRVLRGIVTAIVNGVKNGFQNLAQYSNSFNKSISGLKSSFTQLGNTIMTTVAPVIQALIPLFQIVIDKIIEVSNVIAQFTARLFGNTSTFTKAKKVAEDYAKSLGSANKEQKKFASFDTIEQIETKEEGNGSVSPSEMFETASIDTMISDFADKIKAAIKNGDWYGVGTLLGQKVNDIFNRIDTNAAGVKLGGKINNIFDVALGFLRTVNWQNIGSQIAGFLNGAISTINFGNVGRTLGAGLNMIIHTAYGFIKTFNWGNFGKSIADGVNGLFEETDFSTAAAALSEGIAGIIESIYTFLENVDWQEVGVKIWEFFSNINWSLIVENMAHAFGAAMGGFFGFVWGYFEKVGEEIADYWWDKMQEIGGNVWQGFLLGIYDGLLGIGEFIVEKIWKPFSESFCKAFGIASPSTKMAEFGGFIVEGLKQGIINAWEGLKQKVSDLCTGFIDKFQSIFQINSPSRVMEQMGEYITGGLEEGIGDGNGAFDGLNVLSAESVEDIKSSWGRNRCMV